MVNLDNITVENLSTKTKKRVITLALLMKEDILTLLGDLKARDNEIKRILSVIQISPEAQENVDEKKSQLMKRKAALEKRLNMIDDLDGLRQKERVIIKENISARISKIGARLLTMELGQPDLSGYVLLERVKYENLLNNQKEAPI